MNVLIKNARIIDPKSTHHKKRLDLRIRKGKIIEIKRNLKPQDDEVITAKNLHVSPGWVDIGTQIGEPGFEHRETLESVSKAALAGGYTDIACFPNTSPVIDSKSGVEYILNRTRSLPIDIHPIGSVSHQGEGRDLAELYDMHEAGAVAFSDGRNAIADSGLMLRALQYAKAFSGLVVSKQIDSALVREGQMNESVISTQLGLRGIPALSEFLMTERDLQLTEYANSQVHLYGISTALSLLKIRDARKAGLRVTCSVPAINLLLDDSALTSFNTNLKVLPPLRGKTDIRALIRGLKNGDIDVICSNHEPLEKELKHLEFAYADFGSTGLETAFAMLNTALKGKLVIESIVDKICHGPRRILDLPTTRIGLNEEARLTLFDPDVDCQVEAAGHASLSRNAAGNHLTLTGKVVGVYVGNKWHGR